MGIEDLFKITNIESLGGKFFKNQEVKLEEEKIPKIEIPQRFETIKLLLPEEKYQSEIEQFINKFFSDYKLRKMPETFKVAVYEIILNAHQHGNKKSPEKEIEINFQKQKDTVRIYISDQGGEFPSELIPYIQKLRNTNLKKQNINFYKFSGKERIKGNNNLGNGSYFANLYSDDVRYYKNKQNGLTVFLLKKW